MTLLCPVCSQSTKDARGLASHFNHRRKAGDTAHPEYQASQEEARWAGKTEGTDYIRCLACGLRVFTLARHLKAEHKITAVQYRAAYGEDAKIRCDTLKAKRSMALSTCLRVKGDKKEVVCSSCGEAWMGSKFLAPGTHDFRCGVCKSRDEAADKQEQWKQWNGKSEPQDYVSCRACGDYRADNLTSHIQSAHPNLVGTYKNTYPGSFLVALSSGVRDKISIRGVPRPYGFGQKVSFGKLASEYKHSPEAKEKMSKSRLLLDKIIRLTESDLVPFKKRDGRVSLTQASIGLNRCTGVVKRECVRLSLPYYRLSVGQDKFLCGISTLTGCTYEGEWTSSLFINPKSGRKFRFDGYFESVQLLAEFQGHQHYQFPNRFHHANNEAGYLEACERDIEKRRQVFAHGGFKYLEVREDQPWQDLNYLRKLLTDLEIPTVG